jgi:signal transduction histidine kinase
MKTRAVPSEKREKFLELMLMDTGRLRHLIDTILDLSGLEQKKFTYNFQIVNAESVFRQIASEAADQIKLPDGTVTVSGKANRPCVVDINAMRIVINNLMDNAVKYSVDAPKIDITLSAGSRHILIEFRDQGIGVSQKDQKKIFYKFHRIYRREIPSVKGTGLGLYLVKEIVKAHGGKISAVSEGRGKGTALFIELPIYQTTKKRYINRLLKLTQKWKQKREQENEQ